MSPQPVATAIFDNHVQAEDAIKRLQRSGFDMKALSLIGKDYQTEQHAIGFYNTGDRMRVWGKLGAFWGALLGILFSPAMFLLPGIGHVIVLGPIVATLVGGLEGAAVTGGAGVLAGALASIGIPKDSVIRYETDIKAGKFLVIAHGPPDQVARAQTILDQSSTGPATAA